MLVYTFLTLSPKIMPEVTTSSAPVTDEVEEEVEVDEEATTKEADPKEPIASVTSYASEIGIIEPPPDLKEIVDRTADYVRRNGSAFEQEIMSRNSRSKRFQFLQSDNPYHAYYKYRVQHGNVAIQKAGDASIQQADVQATKTAAKGKKIVKRKKVLTLKERLDIVIKQVKEVKITGQEPPAADKYTVKVPDRYQLVDIDIIKLTAQFVARNGRSFLAGLTAREQHDRQFDFLKPTHPLFSLFQQLVDCYAQVVIPPASLIKELRERVENPSLFLKDAQQRAAHQRKRIEEEKRKVFNEEEERVAMALIDWHTFAVVENITFAPEEEDLLPAPRHTIEDINRMLAQQTLEDVGGAVQEMDMEMDMDVEMEEDMAKSDDEREEKETKKAAEEEETEPSAKVQIEPEEEKAELRKDYVSELDRPDAVERSLRFQKCPVCGQDVPVEELTEHIRIELLDPKWKEQKQAMSDRQRESSLAANSTIAANLSRLARKRTDVFVEGEEKKQQAVKEARERAEKEREARAAAGLPNLPSSFTPVQQPPAPKPPAPSSYTTSTPRQLPQPPTPQVSMRPPQPAPPAPLVRPPMPPQPPVYNPMMSAPSPYGAPMAPMPMTPMAPMHMGAPMGMPMGAPPMPMGMPPMLQQGMTRGLEGGEEPYSKRAKLVVTEADLVPEAEFLHSNPHNITLRVVLPNKPDEHPSFNGQTVDVAVDIKESVDSLKNKIAAALGGSVPGSKLKVNVSNGLFLNKETSSLAAYNLRQGNELSVGVLKRGRGGRKK